MRKLLVLPLLLILAACQTTPTGAHHLTPAGKIALQEASGIAVRRYLRDRPGQLDRVANIRAIAMQLQSATTVVSISGLKDLAAAEVTKRVSDPLDRADALSLLNVFHAVLLEQIGKDEIDSEALVRVNEFLGYIVAALPQV